ncbi:MAG: hypothetical protein ABI321_10145 [Polyangia bacterium]
MTDPQQIRRALGDIRRALDSHPRESLAEILAIVFKEYVVESSAPIASGGQILDARSDLEGLSFPELVVWLQTHLDLPELALLEVSGANVNVRVNGQPVRLEVRAPVPAPAPVASPPQFANTTTIVRNVAPQPAALVAAVPTPALAAAPAAAPAKEEPSTSDTGTRFSLLEVD